MQRRIPSKPSTPCRRRRCCPFDPRKVPFVVGGVDSDLPAVSAVQLTAQALRARFATPPAWTPELRREPRMTDRVAGAGCGAGADRATRAGRDRAADRADLAICRRIRGRCAFPAAASTPRTPTSPLPRCARPGRRSACRRDYIEVLGNLPTYTTVTSFIVTPVVALVQPGFELTINPYEVAQAFEVPLAWLMDPANHRRHAVVGAGRHAAPVVLDALPGRARTSASCGARPPACCATSIASSRPD